METMQQAPSLFNIEHFKCQISTLKDALRSLYTRNKPSFLLLDPGTVPNVWKDEISPVDVLDLLGVSINSIHRHSSRWKSTYFTKHGTGFHCLPFKNHKETKRYIVTANADTLTATQSVIDAEKLMIQTDSEEHLYLLQCLLKLPVPAVTPTNSERVPQTCIHPSTLRINAYTNEQPFEITPNCITPTNNNDEDLESNDKQQCVPNEFFSSFDAEPDVKAALKTLFEYVHSVDNLPRHVQALVSHVMMKSDNSKFKNNIHTIKQCSGPNTQLRFYNLYYQVIPVAKKGHEAVTDKTVTNKANALKAQLDVSVGKDDSHQLQAILDVLQDRLKLKREKADASTQTETVQESDMPMPTVAQSKTRRCKEFWKSKFAINLFLLHQVGNKEEANNEEEEEEFHALEQEFDDDAPGTFADLKCIVRNSADRLRSAFTTADGYRKVLSDKWKKTPVSDRTRFQITLRSRYLVAALENALLKMPEWTWNKCCEEAIIQVNANEGAEFITNSRSLRNWYTSFRRDNCTFDGLVNREHKTRMPKFLEENPEQKALIIKCALENLNQLSVEFLHDYIHSTLLPSMVEEQVSELRKDLDEMENEEGKRMIEEKIGLVTVDSILKANHLTVLNEETIRQWMHKLGFKYEERRKCFFVDSHEREDVVRDRNAFVADSLAKDLRQHCWLQKRADDEDLVKLYEDGQLNRNQGYRFERGGEEWIEFHVDDHKSFFDWGNENCKYGGELSVRFPEGQKPLIRLGQDEAIWKQYKMSKSAWRGNNGEIGLVPKDDGAGVMISAIVSRPFGLGMEWTDELRNTVNEMRAGKKYKDEEAALEVLGTEYKRELQDNPLVRYFRYGANQEGYWNSNHMLCQVEDMTDVLKAVLSFDEYDVELVVDHSQGHDRLRDGGLTVTKMNLLFGGLQAKMRDSQLTSQDDFGPHPRSLEQFYTANTNFFRFRKNRKYEDYIPRDSTAATKQLNINDTHSMTFTEDDVGPFYLTNADREANRYDTVTGQGMKEKTADDLRAELDEKFAMDGVSCNVCLKGARKKKLVELAEENGIDTKKPYFKIRQGWVGTAKGKLQIAFERGLLDPTKSYEHYSEKGRKDVHESIIEGTSIDKLIQSLRDFREEKTLLQVRAEEMGISIVRSPKCHPEIAGEGIEYVWGVSKNDYKRQPLEQKRGIDNFLNLVTKSVSTDRITKEIARGCAARARAYMLAYRARHLLSINASEDVEEELRNNPICFDLLDKCVKKFRAHRSANDFDKSFIKGMMVDKMLQISSNADD